MRNRNFESLSLQQRVRCELDLAARKSQKGRLGTRAASAAHARVRPRPQRGLNSADPAALNSRESDQPDISFPDQSASPSARIDRSNPASRTDSPAEEKGFELPVPLATGSLLLRYGNAVGGEEDRRLAVKFLVKKISVATRYCQYLYPLH